MDEFPELTLQELVDAGVNAFAFELVSESLNGKNGPRLHGALRFTFRGIRYTLELPPQFDDEVPPLEAS